MKENIWRDQYGVCHVEGKNRNDMFRLMGYAHGKDRGMQILLMRILGWGRASEFLDSSDEMLAIDTFFRRMNWGSVAEEVRKLTPEVKEITEAYCKGVNEALSEKTPWEYKLLGYKPAPWRTEDIIMLSRMIGYLTLAQSQGEMERLLIELIQAGMDEERLHELFPKILGGLDIDLIKKVKLQERIVSPPSLWNMAAPLMMASNNWAVSGKKTTSGKPILANDPHLEVNRLPNVWYEMVLKSNGRYAVCGTMPGLPALLIGRNPDFAWSATYTFMDGTDFWIEKCKNGQYFRESDQWIPFRKREEVIRRKKKDPVTVVFYENDHGTLEGDPHQEGYYLTSLWAPANSGGTTLNSVLKVWDVKSVQEGMNLLGKIETSWNLLMADKDGNIGYQMSGLMPKRREGISGFVPLPGWKKENDWHGFEKPEDLPRCYNPDCGYFVTTNQDLNEYGKVKPINMVMGPYRSDRIADLLSKQDCFTCQDMMKIQYDVFSIQAESFIKILSPLLPETDKGKILKEWDLKYSSDSKGAYLFHQFYRELYRKVFGENGFGAEAAEYLDVHTGIFNDFYINFDRILLSETSSWFKGKSREEIYAGAAEKALSADVKSWGEVQKVTLSNIFFGGKLPKFLGFDRGPITIIGSLATPHQGQIFESAGRQTSFAPSYRIITDLAKDEVFTNMAGGPSDRRFSKWYCSDIENWVNGKYKTLRPDDAEKKHKF